VGGEVFIPVPAVRMRGMGLLAVLAYLALALNIIYSALKHRQPGWVGGVAFGVGLLSLPLWENVPAKSHQILWHPW